MRDLARALQDAYALYTSTHRDERAYAFGLYVLAESGLIVGSCFATEEAIARRAAEYEWVLGGTLEERLRVLRWWDNDWPYSNDQPRLFDRCNELLANETDARAIYLDAMRGFPSDLVLGVFGVDRPLTAHSVAELNPPHTVARYRAEVAEGERIYTKLRAR